LLHCLEKLIPREPKLIMDSAVRNHAINVRSAAMRVRSNAKSVEFGTASKLAPGLTESPFRDLVSETAWCSAGTRKPS
jgi:hypothetical protein